MVDSLACGVCGNRHRKFVCTECISEKIRAKSAQYDHIAAETTSLAARIESIVQDRRPPSGISTSQEILGRQERIRRLQYEIAQSRSKVQEEKAAARRLRDTIAQRRVVIQQATEAFRSARDARLAADAMQIKDVEGRIEPAVSVLAHSRRVLVRELVTIFRLRRVQRTSATSTADLAETSKGGEGKATEGSEANDEREGTKSRAATMEEPPEYRIVNVSFSTFGNYLNYPREKFNAGLSHAMHMTILLAHYLNITLPFEIVNRGPKSFAKARAHPHLADFDSLVDREPATFGSAAAAAAAAVAVLSADAFTDPPPVQAPLYLADSNIDQFTIGLAMLNYDIAYLCWTQGVQVPFVRMANTLENLARCCQSPQLGRNVFRVLEYGKAPTSRKQPHQPKRALFSTSNTRQSRNKPERAISSSDTSESLSMDSINAPREFPPTFHIDFAKLLKLHLVIRRQRPRITSRSTHPASSPPVTMRRSSSSEPTPLPHAQRPAFLSVSVASLSQIIEASATRIDTVTNSSGSTTSEDHAEEDAEWMADEYPSPIAPTVSAAAFDPIPVTSSPAQPLSARLSQQASSLLAGTPAQASAAFKIAAGLLRSATIPILGSAGGAPSQPTPMDGSGQAVGTADLLNEDELEQDPVDPFFGLNDGSTSDESDEDGLEWQML
ncbi:UV radiation resistance protein and autophagy-related subunit 14-domain-containing protein [Cladochytrium replicatum]|nr:UV radiation resistance protein and autophagy-related subunit 14-domain-containing protein [Cladochytrium replicatum]